MLIVGLMLSLRVLSEVCYVCFDLMLLLWIGYLGLGFTCGVFGFVFMGGWFDANSLIGIRCMVFFVFTISCFCDCVGV